MRWQDRTHFFAVSAQIMRRILVELRFFAGLSVEQTAEALKISAPSVKRDWKLAKAWLNRELSRR